MRPIDADALMAVMYHEAFETDSDRQKWDSGCWIRYKMFEEHIANAPTVGEWIPVSERFPKSGEYCLVAWVYQHEECCPCPYQHYYGLSSFDTDIPGWDTLGKDDNEIDIIAWMPLPDAYREDGEKE